MPELILLLFSFFLGAIPFGYLIAKGKKNIDIRNYGSGNIGATNVFRVVGKKEGIFVFILDFLKGFLIPFFSFIWSQFPSHFFIFFGLFAIAGHNWTPFLNFKGGKGVATSLGVLAALSFSYPDLGFLLLLALLAWVIVFFLSRIVSLASLAASFIFFFLTLFLTETIEIKLFAFLLFCFIILRHKKNIKRILTKKEGKF